MVGKQAVNKKMPSKTLYKNEMVFLNDVNAVSCIQYYIELNGISVMH